MALDRYMDIAIQVGTVIANRTGNPYDDFAVQTLSTLRADTAWLAKAEELLNRQSPVPPGSLPLQIPGLPQFPPGAQQLSFLQIIQLVIQYGPQIIQILRDLGLFGSRTLETSE